MMGSFLRKLRWFSERRKKEAELEEEIQSYLDFEADELGGDYSAARRSLGNPLRVQETTREQWGGRWLEVALQDLRYGWRQVLHNPGFAAVAVLTIALGLGATTAMFSLVDGILLKPLPYKDPEQLYIIRTIAEPQLNLPGDYPVNAHSFGDWREHCQACESIAIAQHRDMTLTGMGHPVKLRSLWVSFNFFRTLGVEPALGRDFLATEETRDFDKVLISDRFWHARFDADPGVVGREIQLNGESYFVIGVLPPGVSLPKGAEWGEGVEPGGVPPIVRPLGFDVGRIETMGSLNYGAVVRLKPGVTAAQASAEMDAILADYHLDTRTVLRPMKQQMTRDARQALWLLLAAVGMVMLIVCVNVGNMILVKTASREQEAGLRLALGANRGRLFAVVLWEATLLVAMGGVVDCAVAAVGLRAFLAAAPANLPRLGEVGLDWRVLLFALALAAGTAVLCALIPAWRLSTVSPLASLKAASANATTGRTGLRLREGLVAIEVALSTVLLVGGALLLVSFVKVLNVDRGFETQQVIAQDVSFLTPKYAGGGRRAYMERMMPKLAGVPGVQAAGAVSMLPMRGSDWSDFLVDPDAPNRPPEEQQTADFRFIAPGYFKAIGIPLKRGRFLNEQDNQGKTAVVSEGVARYLWPGEDPIGKHLVGAAVRGDKPVLSVVGVVGDVPTGKIENPWQLVVYQHYWRMQPVAMSLVFRTRGDGAAVMGSVRQLMREAAPEMALPAAVTLQQVVDDTFTLRRFELYTTIAFAVAALLLAALGVYGMISFVTASRHPELGVRIAVGAGPGQLIALVLHQAMRPVMVGLGIGLMGALALGGFITSQLYGVEPYDPVTILVVSLVLLGVALAASWIPARRAARIDPMRALRAE